MTAATVKTLIALDEGIDGAYIESSLPAASSLQVVGMAHGLDQGLTLLGETSPDLLVIATSGQSERALYLIEGATRLRPDRPIVVLFSGTPDGFLQHAFDAGADDLIVLPQPAEEIRFAIEKVLARRRGTVAAVEHAAMICVLGPKGGTGKTLTSCNLAVSLAKAGKRTALVDLDLQFGDVGIALGLKPDRTIYDLARVGGSFDAEKVEGYLTVHPASGLRVLLAPTRPDHAALIRTDFLRDVYTTLRSSSDVVVVDTPPSFTPEVIATIDAASHLCMVGMLDALSLKDSKLGLETLELMGRDPASVKLVLNRSTARAGISRDDAEAILGRTPDVFVPEERDIPRTLTEGRPIVLADDRSPAARAFASLAAAFTREFDGAEEVEDETSNGGGRRRLEFLRGRSKD